jgi:hypothetical protein
VWRICFNAKSARRLIAGISFRDLFAAALGDDWVPRIQLHLQFNSLPFLFVFLPCTFALYALYRGTALANWIVTLAGLAFYATAGLIYLVPLLFTCFFDYAVGAYLARASDERRRRIAFSPAWRCNCRYSACSNTRVGSRPNSRPCSPRSVSA